MRPVRKTRLLYPAIVLVFPSGPPVTPSCGAVTRLSVIGYADPLSPWLRRLTNPDSKSFNRLEVCELTLASEVKTNRRSNCCLERVDQGLTVWSNGSVAFVQVATNKVSR